MQGWCRISIGAQTVIWITRGGGGGGRGYSPQILVGMCRGKVKNGPGLRNELTVERENAGLRNELEPFWAWKCGAPERAWAVLSVKNAGLRNVLDPFWAWKCESPELRPGRVLLALWRSNPLPLQNMMVSGTAKSAKKKNSDAPERIFCNLWKWYAPERNFRAENGGLSRGTYPICIHMEVPPPPPPPHGMNQFSYDLIQKNHALQFIPCSYSEE